MPNTVVQALWPRAMAHRGYFYIAWNANGDCISLFLTHGSQYSSF
ncbi:hypothetical protein [Archangium sp.]|nr:hypothetical protein [Archangium sp.]HYO52708.1 hypothetical protein [Archangium sp.]